MVYAQVSKTCGRKAVRVRSPLSAQNKDSPLRRIFILYKQGIEAGSATGAEAGLEKISAEIYRRVILSLPTGREFSAQKMSTIKVDIVLKAIADTINCHS